MREEVRGLRQGMDSLGAAADLARPLEELRGTAALIPVRAGALAPLAERAHAVLAAAGRLPAGLQPPGAAAGQDPTAPATPGGAPPDAAMTVMAALRAPEPQGAAPGDAALTPMAARLAEYQARRAAEAAAAKPASSPAAAPDPAPAAPIRPKPGRDPSPGF